MILANIHTFPLFSMMQQSSTQSNVLFWVILAVVVIAVAAVLLLHILEDEEDDDAAHDAHHHEPEETVSEDGMAKSVVIEEEAEEEAEDVPVIVEVENVVIKDVPAVVEEEEAVEEVVEEVVKTAVIPEPEEPEPIIPDDLRKIEGIGPKISGILNDAGIFTFAQLAAASVAHLHKVVREDAGIRIAHPDTWPEQAQLAADGQWEALEVLQDKLVGGRYVE